MPHNWWTRKNLVVTAAAVVALAFIGFIVTGVSYPEPAASAALGPDWQCSRLAFVFTTCSRTKHSQAAVVRIAKIPVCGRLRT
jgi:adenine-specific DNA methylase